MFFLDKNLLRIRRTFEEKEWRVPERSTLRNEFDSLGARLYIAK